jgi:WD40 repeat protein
MGRFFLTIVLGLGLFLGAAWYFDLLPYIPNPENGRRNGADNSKSPDAVDIGKILYAPQPFPAEAALGAARGKDPIVIACHLNVIKKVDVSSQLDGQLLFIGVPVPDGAILVAGVAPFVAPPFHAAMIDLGDKEDFKFYRRLDEGKTVLNDQVVGLLDPSQALLKLTVSRAKIVAAEADVRANRKIVTELAFKVDVGKRLQRGGTMSAEEVRNLQLSLDRYTEEGFGKDQAVRVAQTDAAMAELHLKQHEIRNKSSFRHSIIKNVYRHGSESAKSLEPIMHLYSVDRLKAEGLVEVQHLNRIREGMLVTLEPTHEDPPLLSRQAHRNQINAVAVSKDVHNPLIVCGSEDGTCSLWALSRDLVRGWLISSRGLLRPHKEPVRSVACSPKGSGRNWCVTGAANGTIRIWDLDKKDKELVHEIPDAHRDSVTALAFSPDGKWFASGSADYNIVLWRTEDGKRVYPFDADYGVTSPHNGTITALHFTPQCRLISAAKDNTLRIWELHSQGARLVGEPIGDRVGNVPNLGVSQDGRLMLLDLGKTLQLLSGVDTRTVNVLQNPTGAIPFETLALFSPDASLILTAGAAEGRLQLWKTPTEAERGYEVRQLVPGERSPVTCAAFAPDAGLAADGSFALSGTKDGYLYVWPVPNKGAVEKHRIPNVPLGLIERALDASSRQVRIGVELPNVDGRLIPGRPVTVVIE